MRRQRLSRLHLLLIVPLTLLVFSARLTWPQERPFANETPTQLSSLAAQFIAVPEGKIRFHPAYEKLSLPFAPHQEQTPSQVRFRAGGIGHHFSATKNNALPELWQLAKADESQAKANHFMRSTPSLVRIRTFAIGYHLPSTKNNASPELWRRAKTVELQARANHFITKTPIEWLTGVNTNNVAHFRTPDPGGDVAYYGHRIPLAGRIILGVGKQAKFHPRVTRVLEVVKPGLGVDKPSPTGGSAGNNRVVGRGPFR